MVENCENCAFGVKRQYSSSGTLDCHRRAPQSFTVFKGIYNGAEQYGPGPYWPEVQPDDFCGEWELTDTRE